jgi:hypothetical protein
MKTKKKVPAKKLRPRRVPRSLVVKQAVQGATSELGPAAPPPALACMFMRPEYLEGRTNAWVGHIPFAFWLIEALRPSAFVELGTHYGNSYFAFCQGVEKIALNTCCYAVDTWRGDEHAGLYGEEVYEQVLRHNQAHYPGFSTLIRSTFDQAVGHFRDGSVDLLHIDGLHTYDAVRHDFESWLPKLSDRAVVLFHDTNVKAGSFGVGRYFHELSGKYPSFEFHHSHGLGVLGVGKHQSEALSQLYAARQNQFTSQSFHSIFSRLGQSCHDLLGARANQDLLEKQQRTLETRQQEFSQTLAHEARERGEISHKLTDLHTRYIDLERELLAAREAQEREGRARGEIAEKLTSLAAEKKGVEEELSSARELITEQGRELEEKGQRVMNLEGELHAAREAQEREGRARGEIAEKLTSLAAEKKGVEEELSSARELITEQARELEEKGQRVMNLEGELLAAREAHEKESRARGEIGEKLTSLAAEKKGVEEELSSARELITEQARELEEKGQRLTNLEGELHAAREADEKEGRERAEIESRYRNEHDQTREKYTRSTEEIAELTKLLLEERKNHNKTNEKYYESVKEIASLTSLLLEEKKQLSKEQGIRKLQYKEFDKPRIKKLFQDVFSPTKSQIRKSGLFDTDWYLENYQDVRKSGIEPVRHYLKEGWKEGRNPSGWFNTKRYLEQYPDVKESGLNPLYHYIRFGQLEGRSND